MPRVLLVLVWLFLCLPAATADPNPDAFALSVEKAMQLAEQNSTALQYQRARLSMDATQHRLGLREYLPQLSIEYGKSDSTTPERPDSFSHQIGIRIRQPLYTGGRTVAARSIHQAELEIQARRLDEARFQIRDRVWQAFHELLVRNDTIEVQRRALGILQQRIEVMRLELEQGRIREIDLLDTRIQENEMQLAVRETELTIRILQFQLAQVLELPPHTQFDLIGSDISDYTGLEIRLSEDQMFGIAQRNSLALQSGGLRIHQQAEQLRLARRQFVPNVSADVGLSVSGPRFPLQDGSFSVGFNVSFPAYGSPIDPGFSIGGQADGTRTRNTQFSLAPAQSISTPHQLTQMQTELFHEQTELTKAIHGLRFQIATKTAEYHHSRESLALVRQSLDLERSRSRITELQLALGQITQAGFLQNQLQVTRVEIQLLEQILALFRHERELEQTLGLSPGELAHIGSRESEP